MLEELRGGLGSSDVDSVRRAAHTLKSNAATFGATEFARLCAELEAHARDGDLTGGAQLLEQIEGNYAAVHKELKRLRAGLA